MATTRLLRSSRPIQLPNSSSSSSSLVKCVRLQSRASLNNGDHHHSTQSHSIAASGKGEIRKPAVAAVKAAAVATTEHVTTTNPEVIPQVLSKLAALIASIRNAMLVLFRDAGKRRRRRQLNLNPQMLIERRIIDCRFFTLLAVAGSLLGSVLCFVDGCVLVMKSCAHYFHTVSKRLDDQGHLVHLLIEAIDMFLVGTALVVFGVGLYVMFVESRRKETETETEPATMNKSRNKLGWVGMQSIGEAKSKIGHAVMMILQVGLLDKFKDIPLVTGFDLACFAAAVLTSSASIFVLSKLHTYI